MTDSIYPPVPNPAGVSTDAIAINICRIAIAAAELAKQTSYASALATFTAAGFSVAAFAAYKTAILNADRAYMQAVDAAGNAGIPPPQPTATQAAGGALAATTYFFKTSYVFQVGPTTFEGPLSTENSFAASINNVITIPAPPSVPAAVGWNCYISNTGGGGSGAETKQNTTPILFTASFVEPTSGLVAGAAQPGASTPMGTTIPFDDGSSLQALTPQNTALSIGLLY